MLKCQTLVLNHEHFFYIIYTNISAKVFIDGLQLSLLKMITKYFLKKKRNPKNIKVESAECISGEHIKVNYIGMKLQFITQMTR